MYKTQNRGNPINLKDVDLFFSFVEFRKPKIIKTTEGFICEFIFDRTKDVIKGVYILIPRNFEKLMDLAVLRLNDGRIISVISPKNMIPKTALESPKMLISLRFMDDFMFCNTASPFNYLSVSVYFKFNFDHFKDVGRILNKTKYIEFATKYCKLKDKENIIHKPCIYHFTIPENKNDIYSSTMYFIYRDGFVATNHNKDVRWTYDTEQKIQLKRETFIKDMRRYLKFSDKKIPTKPFIMEDYGL